MPARSLPSIVVRKSKIQGRGVYAGGPIAEGARIIEYTGARISHAEADGDSDDDNPARRHHTFFFAVDDEVVIDGSDGGSDARYVNHSCDPNCETVISRGRVYIHALRDIEAGEELVYDYWYVTDESYTLQDLKRIYPCRCGAPSCRGTLARPPRPPRRRRAAAARGAR